MIDNFEENEITQAKQRLGKIIKYIDKDCPKCGRHRVELFESKKEICEKCHYCLTDKDYDSDHILIYG